MAPSQHAVATLLAVTSSRTKSAMMNFAVQKVTLFAFFFCVARILITPQLFYDSRIEITIAVLATFSAFCFGCVFPSPFNALSIKSIYNARFGLVGVLRPLTIYPSEMVYWHVRSPYPV
jgi:hypothetical protein